MPIRRCLGLVMLTALVAQALGAQTSSATAAAAGVVANILGPLMLTRVGDTDFGPVDGVAHVETIDPVNPGTKSTAQFTASGSPNMSIVVTFDATLPICVNPGGCPVASMTFTPNVSHSQTNSQATAAPGLASGTAVPLSAIGNGYFWLGGSLQVNANQRSGPYSGTFTLSVAYP